MSASPSGSVNTGGSAFRSRMKGLSPIVRLWSEMGFVATGGSLGGGETVTAKVVCAVPPYPSLANTVIVAPPSVIGTTLTTLPSI